MIDRLKEMIVCIPTYKREWPSILACIRLNQDIDFTMFVRKDDYEAGYYDKPQFKLDNLSFVIIDGVHELGMTREKMLQYAINKCYKYCMQIDDSQFGLQDITETHRTLSEILEECLKRFETDKHKDKAFAMNFVREVEEPEKRQTYFYKQFCQTFILNCQICKDYDLHFHNLDKCGLEDLSFVIHAADKGLIEMTDYRFLRIGRQGSLLGEKGGCHGNDDTEEYARLNLKRANDLANYVMSCKDIKDKKFLLIKNSIFFPGTIYCKFDCDYARRKLL